MTLIHTICAQSAAIMHTTKRILDIKTKGTIKKEDLVVRRQPFP